MERSASCGLDRARGRVRVDMLELHAHGYLPRRPDAADQSTARHGGTANRPGIRSRPSPRWPVWPAERPISVRISAVTGGWRRRAAEASRSRFRHGRRRYRARLGGADSRGSQCTGDVLTLFFDRIRNEPARDHRGRQHHRGRPGELIIAAGRADLRAGTAASRRSAMDAARRRRARLPGMERPVQHICRQLDGPRAREGGSTGRGSTEERDMMIDLSAKFSWEVCRRHRGGSGRGAIADDLGRARGLTLLGRDLTGAQRMPRRSASATDLRPGTGLRRVARGSVRGICLGARTVRQPLRADQNAARRRGPGSTTPAR